MEMPATIEWDDDAKTRTLFTFDGKWTWEEYYQARAKGIEMVNSVPHTVNLIVDYTHSSFFPDNMLSNFGSSLQKVPKDFDLAVIVTNSNFVIAMVNMISKLTFGRKVKFRVTRSLDEARAIFAKYDAVPESIDNTRARRPTH
jgi:hypothetical protein